MADLISDWKSEGEQLIDLFCRDPEQRQQVATELAYVGIRIRRALDKPAARGPFETAAGSVLPFPVLSKFWESAREDGRPTVQCEAIFAIGELGGQESVEILTRFLDEAQLSEDSDLYRAAMRALAKIGGKSVLDYFLQHSSDAAVRGFLPRIKEWEEVVPEFRERVVNPVLGESKQQPEMAVATQVRQYLEGIRDAPGSSPYARWLAEQCL